MAGIQGQLTIGPSRASRRGPRSSSIIYDIVLLLAGIPPAGALPCAAKAKFTDDPRSHQIDTLEVSDISTCNYDCASFALIIVMTFYVLPGVSTRSACLASDQHAKLLALGWGTIKHLWS
ncbi:hypothetical protein TEQG_08116 [Trichophyton equinum CBS 127.97]|uniref:Uncharacterized protein n=1 Tax=Trichophyton equinum (strain ATCC MYA-4606 / CBS 127.97) TaxID=559882 RepID=F2Q4U5_TRIEC|nr:hypothetical protein TEQG_08116 [Trichophyton equinum CBS 127.97]